MRVVPALRRQQTQPTTERTSLTVLIPFRNEIARLPGLLDALARQDIPAGWQVNYFWINDHSTDGGDAFLREQISRKDQRLIDLPESRVGKKAALQAGLQESSAEWLLCTDADTLPGPGWIRQMVCWAVLKNWQFATGGVVLTGNAMVQRLQHWDMVAMMAITWLGWERGWWLLANGASLLLTREAAIRAGGWRQESLASGDDLFLVRRLHEQGYAGGFVADRQDSCDEILVCIAGTTEAMGYEITCFARVGDMGVRRISVSCRLDALAAHGCRNSLEAGAGTCWELPPGDKMVLGYLVAPYAGKNYGPTHFMGGKSMASTHACPITID